MKIVIFGCDHHAEILPIVEHFAQKFWPDCPYEMVACLPTAQADVGFEIVNLGRDYQYATNARIFLTDHYDEEEFLLFLDDYVICHPVNTEMIEEADALIHRPDISAVRLSYKFTPQDLKRFPEDDRFRVIPPGVRYSFSQQITMWDTETFLSNLRDGEDAWRLETAGSRRFPKASPRTLLGVAEPTIDKINYVNKGRTSKKTREWVEKNW